MLPRLGTSCCNLGEVEGRGAGSTVPDRQAGLAPLPESWTGLPLSCRPIPTGQFQGANLESYAQLSSGLCLLLTLGSRGHLTGRQAGRQGWPLGDHSQPAPTCSPRWLLPAPLQALHVLTGCLQPGDITSRFQKEN